MKRTLFIAAAIVSFATATAQFFYSNNQQIIKELVLNSFFVVEQSYQLQDSVSRQLFGRNNQDEFGKLRFLAVKTKEGYIASNHLFSPWLIDENCARYLNRYRGVVSKTSICEIADTVSSQRVVELQPTTRRNQFLCLANDSLFQNTGFTLTHPIGKTDGWVVWLTAKNGAESLSVGDDVVYLIYKKELDISTDSISYEIPDPVTENDVLGGIYITPAPPQIGCLEFNLCGVILNEGGVWRIVLPSDGDAPAETVVVEQNEIALTPIVPPVSESKKDRKSKKKNNNEQ